MPNRSQDWLDQAWRDFEQATASQRDARHEWACFAAQQAAEKAVKALHLDCGPPFEHYGPLQSAEALRHASEILEFVAVQMAKR